MIGGCPVLVAPGVHAAAAPIEQVLREAGPARDDLAAVEGLPVWRSREHLAGRALLRRLLVTVTEEARPDERIGGDPGTRPHLPRLPEVGVSVAHTEQLVAVAAATGYAVGIDIETPRPVSRALMRRCCTPHALNALDRMDGERRWAEFAGIWTVLEAYVKALGTGFTRRPRQVPVQPGSRSGHWNGCRWRLFPDLWPVPAACAFRSSAAPGAGGRGGSS